MIIMKISSFSTCLWYCHTHFHLACKSIIPFNVAMLKGIILLWHFLLQYTDLIAAAAKSLQSCPTLCDAIDGSPRGSTVPGILLARTLEWVAISFSNAWKWKVKGKLLSRVRLFATPWTASHQAPPSMGFSRQECWSGVPSPSPTDLIIIVNICCNALVLKIST